MSDQPKNSSERKMEIANEILRQLGGRVFTSMTGAKDFIAMDSGLAMKLPGTLTRDRVNYAQVILTPDDEYHLKFFKIRGVEIKPMYDLPGVYCDNLREAFSSLTGLSLEMPIVLQVRHEKPTH
jgi:hypothetical protein